MKQLIIQEYKSFQELYEKYNKNKDSEDFKSLLLLFIGSDDPNTKKSWCSDCRDAKPIIDKVVQDFQFNEQLILAKIEVGQRDEWKSADNPYRSHELKIAAVPTMISLKLNKRLVESECQDASKVSHLFSNSL